MSKVLKSYKEQSRINWGRHMDSDESMSIDEVNCGALLRIADASEAMAKNHVKLQGDYDFMKESRDYWEAEAHKLRRQIRALKGVITKLKIKEVSNG